MHADSIKEVVTQYLAALGEQAFRSFQVAAGGKNGEGTSG
jgi:hypothetical protein